MMEIPCVTSKKRKDLSSTTSLQQFHSKTPRLLFNPTTFDHDSSTSSCSSCGSDMRIRNADLQEESGSFIVEVEASMCYSERERKSSETTAYSEVEEDTSSSEKLDTSMEKPVSISQRRSKKKKESNNNMPTESELEDFFAQAEQNLHKQFSNKYNYDVVKDMPLQGRYEWLKLKP